MRSSVLPGYRSSSIVADRQRDLLPHGLEYIDNTHGVCTTVGDHRVDSRQRQKHIQNLLLGNGGIGLSLNLRRNFYAGVFPQNVGNALINFHVGRRTRGVAHNDHITFAADSVHHILRFLFAHVDPVMVHGASIVQVNSRIRRNDFDSLVHHLFNNVVQCGGGYSVDADRVHLFQNKGVDPCNLGVDGAISVLNLIAGGIVFLFGFLGRLDKRAYHLFTPSIAVGRVGRADHTLAGFQRTAAEGREGISHSAAFRALSRLLRRGGRGCVAAGLARVAGSQTEAHGSYQ